MKNFTKLLFTTLLCFGWLIGQSQTINPAFPPTEVIGGDYTGNCASVFDSGGPTGTYPTGVTETSVICPDAGETLTITFNEFELEAGGGDGCWDDLQIIIGTTPVPGGQDTGTEGFCGDDVSALPSGGVFVGTAPDECITLILTSDASFSLAGWDISVSSTSTVSGCTDMCADNFDPLANCDDDGCTYAGLPLQACDDGDACTINDMESVAPGCIPCAGTLVDCATAGETTMQACDDGDPCTTGDMEEILNCDGSVCEPCAGTVPPPPVPACGGMATDSGSCADYPNNASETTTICPDPGETLTITFTEFEVEDGSADGCWDDLQIILDSDATGAGGTAAPGGQDTGTGGFCGADLTALPNGGVFTATAPDACITLILTSDVSTPQAGFTVDITCVLAPLPVELAFFNGKTLSKSNMLEWTTASEENTEWHVIERSNDGRSEWTEIGRTQAKGFSTELVNYQLEDNTPLAKSYYRLRSVDFDRYEDISSVVYLERKIEQFDIVKVYPVPTSRLLNIDFETPQDQQIEITMTDMLGKVISTRPVNSVAGINNTTFDMGNLTNGVYFVTINNGQDQITQRVIKN